MNWDGNPPLTYSLHAARQMMKRNISKQDVESVVRDANNTYPGHGGCTCLDAYTSRGRLRVVLDVKTSALIVVSTYYLS
jgi:hypothetical protein